MPETFSLSCSAAPCFRFVLDRSLATLGRSVQCDFVVSDSTVSRKHAEINIRGCELYVTDLHSRNGTFVENQRIQTSPILHGQVVRFGSIAFVVTRKSIWSAADEETDFPPQEGPASGTPTIAVQERLSEAQRKVFDLLLTGLAEKSIARRLHLSQHTVHNHVRTIFRIYGVHARAELFALLLEQKKATI